MQAVFTHKFKKQVLKCKNDSARRMASEIIQQVILAQSLSEIKNLKKLKGFRNIYRIKAKDYRIGFVFENETIIFAAFDHRADIYKYFP